MPSKDPTQLALYEDIRPLLHDQQIDLEWLLAKVILPPKIQFSTVFWKLQFSRSTERCMPLYLDVWKCRTLIRHRLSSPLHRSFTRWLLPTAPILPPSCGPFPQPHLSSFILVYCLVHIQANDLSGPPSAALAPLNDATAGSTPA